MANMNSSLLGSGWYDAFDGETIENGVGGEDLKNEFGIGGAGIIFMIRPDKSYTGAFLSHYGNDVKFEDIFDAEEIPIDDTPIVEPVKGNNSFSLDITQGNGKLSLTPPMSGAGMVSIFTTSGRKIAEKSVNLTKGSNISILSTDGLSSGTYLFNVSIGNTSYNKRVIISN